jgi:hypothetical protein
LPEGQTEKREEPPPEPRGADSGPEDTVEGEVVEDDAPEGPSAIVERDGIDALANLATEEQIERAIRRVIARTVATKKYKAAMMSMTNVRDWYSHAAEGDDDGVPYLAESGAEKVIHAFEIEVHHDGGKRVSVDEGGYEFVYTGRMRALAFSELWYEVVGSRWSEDGFFTRGGKCTADPGDVRKAAWTNFMNRGIKTVCGLKSLTWDELEAIPGMEGLRTKVRRIGFAGGSGPAPEPGEISDIEKGPHIKVRIDKDDVDSREAIKRLPKRDRMWNKNPGCFYWVVRWSKQNFGTCCDLKAANDSVVFKTFNVPADELP